MRKRNSRAIFTLLVWLVAACPSSAEAALSVMVRNQTGYDLAVVKYVREVDDKKYAMSQTSGLPDSGAYTFNLTEEGSYRVYASFIMDRKVVYAKGSANDLHDGNAYTLTLLRVVASQGGAGIKFINKKEFDSVIQADEVSSPQVIAPMPELETASKAPPPTTEIVPDTPDGPESEPGTTLKDKPDVKTGPSVIKEGKHDRTEVIRLALMAGNRYYCEKDNDKAIKIFRKVLLLDPDNEEAMAGIEKAMKAAGRPYSNPIECETKDTVKELARELSAPSDRNKGGMGRILICSEPQSADIYINGDYRAKTPAEMSLDAGEYLVVIVKELYKAESIALNIRQGINLPLSIRLSPR